MCGVLINKTIRGVLREGFHYKELSDAVGHVVLTSVVILCETPECLFSLTAVVEICMLFKCRRVASVKAVGVCELYSLDRNDFEMILKRFPKMKQVLHNTCVHVQ